MIRRICRWLSDKKDDPDNCEAVEDEESCLQDLLENPSSGERGKTERSPSTSMATACSFSAASDD